MAETILEQVLLDLRNKAEMHYPSCGEVRNLRVVGHTPKSDHFIYDTAIEFSNRSERVAIKVYRPGKCGGNAKGIARQENANLLFVNQTVLARKRLDGIPRLLGDYSELGAVVTDKVPGLPVQSIIMKAALLPGFADNGSIALVARRTGEWLRAFHKTTADSTEPFDGAVLLASLEKLCQSCLTEGLDESSIRMIMSGARNSLAHTKKSLPTAAVLMDFTPLNVIVTGNGVGYCEFARMRRRGNTFEDMATFLASVEALEKYPFCNRKITGQIQENFLESYGVTQTEAGILRVFKMKALLAMFAQGRTVKESAVRKKVMWANVMRKFIHQAAERSMSPAAAA